jgi:hypothetical protein
LIADVGDEQCHRGDDEHDEQNGPGHGCILLWMLVEFAEWGEQSE